MNPFESNVSRTMQGSFTTTNTHKYSVILPTYNERKNLPVIIWLLNKVFQERCVVVCNVRIERSQAEPSIQFTVMGDYYCG
jgi:hypothetical protein